jgi:membrane protein
MANSKGQQVNSPWKMSLSHWKQVLVRTWTEQSEDNISLAAAGVAFYGFLALVPLLGAIVLTYGIAADPQTVLSNMKSLTSVLPGDVAKLIGDQLISIVHTSASKKGLGLLVALAVALWGARNAATSIITALNIAYEEEETRSTIRVNLLALAITAGGVVMAVLALLAITALGYLQKMLPHLPDLLIVLGKLLSYIVLLLGAAAGAATLYRYAPSRPEARWEWITPGSMLSSLLWLVLTLGFGFYVAHFGNYNKAYGALATVVILVTWMYLSAYVFLLGAELNSELERQTASGSAMSGPVAAASSWSADRRANRDQRPAAAAQAGPSSFEHAASSQAPSALPSYVIARATNRADQFAGLNKVGMVCAALSTIGLSLLRKRGREGAGAMLVAGAVGLSLLKRRN